MKKSIPKLYGLILAGGQSKRMGQDKSAIVYREMPHAEYCFGLLSQHCESVFMSLSPRSRMSLIKFPHFVDASENLGPMAGIVAAMTHDPTTAWLVIATDFPRIDHQMIQDLVSRRMPELDATAFESINPGDPEPLFCIYEPSIRDDMERAFSVRELSPKAVLKRSSIRIIEPKDPALMVNANEPTQRDLAFKLLASQST